jgi:hypothetical protein
MFATLFSVALFSSLAIQGALADIAVGTPKLTQVRPPMSKKSFATQF